MDISLFRFCSIPMLWMSFVLTVVSGHAFGGVVFYNSFDGTVDAQIGVAPKATVHDGPARFEAGKLGQALLAGDGNAYLSFDVANLPVKEGTIEFWIRPVNWDAISTSTFHVWVETGNDGEGSWFVFYKYYNDQTVRFIREGIESLVDRKNFNWDSLGWIHLAITWSQRGSTIYWNGHPSGTLKPLNPPDEYPGPLLIGDRAWGGDMERKDERTLVDEMYFYDRALEPEEIAWAYQNAETRTPGADVPTGLVSMKAHAKILPSQGKIIAEVRHWLDANSREELTGTAELLGPTPFSPVTLTVDEHTAEAELRFDELSEGDYKLRVQLTDASGEVVEQAVDEFYVPSNEWLGNTIGISDVPPPPFTPIEASNDGFSCMLREYSYDRSGFPRQIAIIDEDLLAYPISLRASSNGRRIEWRHSPVQLTEQSAVAAEYTGQWQGVSESGAAASQYLGPGGVNEQQGSAVLQMDWQAVAEYDGMIKYTLTLTPMGDPVKINDLELRFPLRPEFATLINSSAAVGVVPEGRGPLITASTCNWWWLGNEERGLGAFCESDEAWDRIDRPDGFRIQRRGKAVEAVWSFVGSKSITLDGPWTFTFGMTATPVKDTAGQSGRPSRLMYMNPWLMEQPRSYTDAGLAVMIENEGIREKLWSDFQVLWLGGEWTEYEFDWRRRPSLLEFMPEEIAKLKAKGIFSLEYFLSREVPETIPEWRYWSDEWAVGKKVGWTNEVWDSTTCTQSWIDFIVWYIMNNIERYGFSGAYMDNALPVSTINQNVGAGYMRDGVMRPTMPWFEMRELFKRLYTAVKQNGIDKDEPSMLTAHMSGGMPIAYLGFMDNRIDGEQFRDNFLHREMAPGEVMSLDVWRSRLLSSNFGNMCTMLSYPVQSSRSFVSLLLLHNTGIWIHVDSKQMYLKPIHDMWTLQDEFGIEDAEFLPYWNNQRLIAGQTGNIKASAYQTPEGGTLIIIANLDKNAQTASLQIDWSELKSEGDLTVTDAETGAALQVKGRLLSLDVPALDYRAVQIK